MGALSALYLMDLLYWQFYSTLFIPFAPTNPDVLPVQESPNFSARRVVESHDPHTQSQERPSAHDHQHLITCYTSTCRTYLANETASALYAVDFADFILPCWQQEAGLEFPSLDNQLQFLSILQIPAHDDGLDFTRSV